MTSKPENDLWVPHSFALEEDEEQFAKLHGLLADAPIAVRVAFVDQVMASLVQEEDRLDDLLERSVVPVRAGFSDEVMANLPEVDGARSRRAPWAAAVAAVVVLGLLGTMLVGRSSEASLVTGILASIGALFTTGLAAGAGFLGASWSGLGTVASEALQGSPTSLALLAAMAVASGGTLYGLLRRRRSARVRVASRDE